MKVGDKVRFLNSTGGGIVRGFQGKDARRIRQTGESAENRSARRKTGFLRNREVPSYSGTSGGTPRSGSLPRNGQRRPRSREKLSKPVGPETDILSQVSASEADSAEYKNQKTTVWCAHSSRCFPPPGASMHWNRFSKPAPSEERTRSTGEKQH